MNAWSPNTSTLPNLTSVTASQTDVPISKKFPITAGGSKYLVVCITTTAASGTVTAKLRTSISYGVSRLKLPIWHMRLDYLKPRGNPSQRFVDIFKGCI